MNDPYREQWRQEQAKVIDLHRKVDLLRERLALSEAARDRAELALMQHGQATT